VTEYKPTQAELDAFIRDKNGYSKPMAMIKTEKPKNGKLVYVLGNYVEVILNDKPFNLLQSQKAKMIKQGYKKENLFIKNL